MDVPSINNYVGDIDLPLLDAILKNQIPSGGRVLDIGCGTGRNAPFFLQNSGYLYTGVDPDPSSIRLLEVVWKNSNSQFHHSSFQEFKADHQFDFVICSQVFHLLDASESRSFWVKINNMLTAHGVVYASMDSTLDNNCWEPLSGEIVQFRDGKKRRALTKAQFDWILGLGFEELEPHSTWVKEGRAQTFMLLKKA